MGVRLAPEEQWAMLEAAHTGIFTSLRRDGRPVALPVWFVVVDRRIYLRTPAKTKKVARIRNDERCSFLVESGLAWRELEAVHLSGRAVLVEPGADARASCRPLPLAGIQRIDRDRGDEYPLDAAPHGRLPPEPRLTGPADGPDRGGRARTLHPRRPGHGIAAGCGLVT